MSQTTYSEKPRIAMPGQLADYNEPQRITTGVLEADVPFGIFVKKSGAPTPEGHVMPPDAAADLVRGILIHTHYVEVDGLTGINDAKVGDVVPVLEKGTAYVLIEEDVAEDDPVFVRHTPNGANTQRGACRNDNDGGNALRVVGATFRRGGTMAGGAVAPVSFDLEASRT